MQCPDGHNLPHETESGQCTPMYCAAPSRSSSDPDVSAIVVRGGDDKADYSGTDEERHVNKGLVKEAIRNKALKVPTGLKGAAAEQHVDGKLTELSVAAVAVLEERLRFGNDDQRYRAARDVLAATGHGPREAGGRVGALIIIQANGEQSTLPPWKRKPVVIDAKDVKVTPAKKKKDDEEPN